MDMAWTLGSALYLLLLHVISTGAIPAAPCSSNKQLEFIRDEDNICGYYLCHDGSHRPDPVSGKLLKCAPGTSTRYAPWRSNHSPCKSHFFDNVCQEIVPSVTYPDPGSTSTEGPTTSGTTHMSTTTTATPHSTTGSTTTTVIYSRPVEVFRNGHVHGGSHLEAFSLDQGPVTLVTSRRLCHRACDLNATCWAFDWDNYYATCWLHTETTACGQPKPKRGCEHVRLVDCVRDTTPSQPTYAPTTTYNPSTVKPTTHSPPPVKGYVERHVDAHVKKGRLVLTKATKRACRAYCSHFPTCAAVDFDSYTETCWLHTEDTACGPLVPKKGCIHYKRLSCQKNGPAPMFLHSFPDAHIHGGRLLCKDCTMTQCQNHCLHHSDCAGADYNSQQATCFGHRAATACNRLVYKKDCTHFRRIRCAGYDGWRGHLSSVEDINHDN